MKTAILMIVFLGLLTVVCGLTRAEEWVEYGQSDATLFLYDTETISHPSAAIARVSVKDVPRSEEARQKEIIELTRLSKQTDFSTYAHTVRSEEINCEEGTKRLMSEKIYGSEGVLYSSDRHADRWTPLKPKTPEGTLYRIICIRKIQR